MLTIPRQSISNWRWDDLENATKESVLLTFDSVEGIQGVIPVNVIRGVAAGPTLLVVAAVHGDEYEGVQTAIELFRNLNPDQIRGTVVIVPVANTFAYEGGSRTTPQDGCNLARTFPGDSQGTLTERLAWHLHHDFIARSDFLLDLHSGGEHYALPALVGYYHDPQTPLGQRSQRAAGAFGLEVLWGHSHIAPGRTVSSAQQLGIPWLYTEAYGGKRILPEQQQSFYWGAIRLIDHLGMLREDGEAATLRQAIPSAPMVRYRLHGDGNFDSSTCAEVSGFFIPVKSLLDYIEGGEPIGGIYDWHGQLLQEVCSSHSGMLVMLTGTPYVKQGDHLYLIADLLDSGK